MAGDGKLLYEDLTYQLNGLFFKVHGLLGRFAREKQYCDSLEEIFKSSGVEYKREFALGNTGNRFDFVIEDKIIIEVKVKDFIGDTEYSQLKRYLDRSGMELGILVNFRDERLTPKRVLKPGSPKTPYSE